MKKLLTLCILLFSFSFAAAEPARLALVIGNASYDGEAALRNPVNDATDVAATLTANGWKVTLVTNMNRRSLIDTVDLWGEALLENPGANALFYYAGHGMQVDGLNYLLPIQTPFNTLSDVKHDGLNLTSVTDAIEASKSLVSVIILDSCRNNPFAKGGTRSVGGTRGLTTVSTAGGASGSLVMFSTSPGEVAQDGSGRNGVFTAALLKQLGTDLKLEDLAKRVTAEVRSTTGDLQKPWLNASLSGDFYLVSDQIRQSRASELAKQNAVAAQKAVEARQAELDALALQIQTAEATKVAAIQKQLDQTRAEAEAARLAVTKAETLAKKLAEDVARPAGKVRFESSVDGQVYFGNALVGAVGPVAPLLADSLPDGNQVFRFESEGRASEQKPVTVTPAAYTTLYFGPLISSAKQATSAGGIVVALSPGQEGSLILKARPLSDSGATLLPVLASTPGNPGASKALDDDANFAGLEQELKIGANAVVPGSWLVSAQRTEDDRPSWYKVYTVRRSATVTAAVPAVGYSIPYQVQTLKGLRASLLPQLKTAQELRAGQVFWGYLYGIPAAFLGSLAGAWAIGLRDPGETFPTERIVIFAIPAGLLGFASWASFSTPNDAPALQKSINSIDKQLRELGDQ